MPLLPVDQSKLVPGHPEAWAPVLLHELIAHGEGGISPQAAAYIPWAAARRLNAGDYGPLLGTGSWNHQIMIESCLVWLGDHAAIEWIATLLEYQLGIRQPPDGQSILAMFGGTETLSCEYEMFRVGSYAAVALLAKRFPSHPQAERITFLVSSYFAVLEALLFQGATSWRDESQFKGAAGEWYTGVMVSPVGERSAVGHFENDLGPFVSSLYPDRFVSKREDWPMTIVRELGLKFNPLAMSALGGGWAWSGSVRFYAPMHWIRYAGGSAVVWKDSRLNNNTACVMWSIALATTHAMTLGYPWPPDRAGARHSTGAGSSCAIEGDKIIARNPVDGIVSVGTLPKSEIVEIWYADQAGVRKEK